MSCFKLYFINKFGHSNVVLFFSVTKLTLYIQHCKRTLTFSVQTDRPVQNWSRPKDLSIISSYISKTYFLTAQQMLLETYEAVPKVLVLSDLSESSQV